MLEWWNNLSLVSQIFTAMAVPATVVMIIQALLLLLGIGGGDGDVDVDDISDIDAEASEGLSLISVRGIVAFFSVGGWAGLVCDTGELPVVISVLIATAAGLAAMIGVALLFKSIMKLQTSGNIVIQNAVGKTATVYIPIPPRKEGRGKVTVLVQNRFVELEAMTEDERCLETNETVTICAVADTGTVIVCGANKTDDKKDIQKGVSKWVY
ncbi:MAG: hypothetical protein IJC94_04140 [Oscillospiraceae bacterium]|nr:hypothetical protein [Oscillospiraceae bacterium]MBQ9939484.1 hypothetical protein [Oscillospiraceae bacterium]